MRMNEEKGAVTMKKDRKLEEYRDLNIFWSKMFYQIFRYTLSKYNLILF